MCEKYSKFSTFLGKILILYFNEYNWFFMFYWKKMTRFTKLVYYY